MAAITAEAEHDRDDLVEYLANLTAFARRQPAITAKLTTDEPTRYDRAHTNINNALDDLLRLT